ncbi:carboxypeptidase-like regulatory domain-containing protein [Cyanobacterium aponinum UTEX 3221]|uniref:Carboxypeptidase regulatory-like domain-containing protein n=1 Tax=Cyanobacterium aponinum 0216 TaxID=2676140 RepID=A0A844GVT1_9CHRO|nr:carboxypeptidase-like regulatory domain-containing protein [Cyanobacterium aponinum]MTF38969.1 carboxypeptidase regulatory-like domain-containing protein [Cyanobacterium aponinum 0216]PHV62796.1 hypothetical protein CSQ80_08760 [Cyanobacterium aponinum IPPAS B-1201]WRL37706.1 carboxypeptidase-like regulatory domain-containing protein [Cyanobacterium aponinum UTEX 3221]
MKLRTLSSLGLGLVLASVIHQPKTSAHGVAIDYQATEAIAIQAKYDSGKPMSNAQVVVYAPNNPTQAWQTGVTDSDGKFTFVPEPNVNGNWTIKVRSAGHGSVVNIPIEPLQAENDHQIQEEISENPNTNLGQSHRASSSITGELSTPQKILMALTGSWGFVGTALFFSRKKQESKVSN